MRVFLFLLLIPLIISCELDGNEYFQKTAKEKLDCIWKKLSENKNSSEFHTLFGMGKLFLESMSPTFELKGDELPQSRKKYIHKIGKSARATYVSTGNHPFTGVFEGCDYVLIKGSSVKEQGHMILNFTPGIAVKFLRDKVHSGNLIVMYSVNGQKSRNFFRNNMSNHISDPKGIILNSLAMKFYTKTKYIQALGLKELAEYNCKGEKIEKYKFPFKLILKPSDELRYRYNDSATQDYMEQLGNVTTGTKMYDVWAQEEPNHEEIQIGYIITTSEMIPSVWGDESLFFKHSLMEDDLKEKPEWEPFVPKYSIFGSSSKDKDLEEMQKKENL